MALLRFILRLILLLVAMFVILPLVILTITYSQRTKNRNLNKKVIKLWSKILCKICGLRIISFGTVQKNPVFIVANHVTWLDIPVIHSQKLVGFVAKHEISQWPILGWVVKSGETLFISRGKHESRKKVLELIDKRLNQGRSIAVFPEGKVTDGSYVGRFHRQLMHAAIETQTPIQAIAIKYLLNNGQRNTQVTFRENESFISNVFRILSLPSSSVEIHFCDSIKTNDLTARQAAKNTYNQVQEVLMNNDYM